MPEGREAVDRQQGQKNRGLGALGWISVAGFVIMGALYVLSVTTDASALISPAADLAIASLAGIGAVLFWYGNDPTAGRNESP
jgi:hypothetical protein